jgi:hypothetical protein
MDALEARSQEFEATLSAKVLDSRGNVIRDLGVISSNRTTTNIFGRKLSPWQWRLLLVAAAGITVLAVAGLIKLAVLFFALFGIVFSIVTTAGVTFEAAAFAGGSAVSNFNWHDSGTGTNAAATSDTALQTPTGIARSSGTQSTPGSTNVYQTVATITYNSTFAVTEWGLFSAASSGTLWDRRVFSAINVVNGNAIQFTYALTIPAGGS